MRALRKLFALGAAAAGLALISATMAPAPAKASGFHGHGFKHGGFHHGGFRGGFRGGFPHGGFRGGFYQDYGYGYGYGVRFGRGYPYGYGGFRRGYAYPGIYPGFYGGPTIVVAPRPSVRVIEVERPVLAERPAAQGAAPPVFVYFCESENGFYPYVAECPQGWTEIPTTLPPPGAGARAQAGAE